MCIITTSPQIMPPKHVLPIHTKSITQPWHTVHTGHVSATFSVSMYCVRRADVALRAPRAPHGQHPQSQECNAVPLSHAEHSTAHHSIVLYAAAQHSAAQHTSVQHRTTQYSTAQHSTAQYSTAQFSTAQFRTVQHSTARAAQRSTVQDGAAPHRTALSFFLGLMHPTLPTESQEHWVSVAGIAGSSRTP